MNSERGEEGQNVPEIDRLRRQVAALGEEVARLRTALLSGGSATAACHAALLAAIPDIVMEVDANKVYTWANPAGLEFFGSDVLGREAATYFEGEQDTYRRVQPLFGGEDCYGPAMFEDISARFRDALSGTLRIKDIARGLGTFSRVDRADVTPVNVHHAVEQAVSMASNEIKYRARLVKDFGQVPLVLGSDGKLAQVFGMGDAGTGASRAGLPAAQAPGADPRRERRGRHPVDCHAPSR